ncbi:hypothetical protein KR49_06765 [Synechococcus sp. KORDI-49]|jgi:hypothetical protein|nr:hypothetical protein KR49_06765 [Synechococcus sp. KORDI-49]HCX54575.1 hypothetical protein [Synechococcus sp. UBA9887]
MSRPARPVPDLAQWLYRGTVVVLLGLIAHAIAKPTAVERCIDRRYQQVLDSHQLKEGQITEAIRISERNKATNFCHGGSGRQNWSR